jgi:hypothetical protein
MICPKANDSSNDAGTFQGRKEAGTEFISGAKMLRQSKWAAEREGVEACSSKSFSRPGLPNANSISDLMIPGHSWLAHSVTLQSC